MVKEEDTPLDQILCMHAVTPNEIQQGLDLTSAQLRALGNGEMLVRREILHQGDNGRLAVSYGEVMTYTEWRQLVAETDKKKVG